jgi:hypothetical protein
MPRRDSAQPVQRGDHYERKQAPEEMPLCSLPSRRIAIFQHEVARPRQAAVGASFRRESLTALFSCEERSGAS